MKLEEASQKIAELYGRVAVWVYDNPVETDALIVFAVVGSCAWYWRRQRRQRSRAFRLIRGALMKRKDREKYHLMAFEDAITNCAMNMVADGSMTAEEERAWYTFFSTNYSMGGLVSTRDEASIKRAIQFRLMFFGSIQYQLMEIPGPKPGEGVIVDVNYQPVVEDDRRNTTKSRYYNGG